MNQNLTREIEQLQEQNRFLRDQNTKLLEKIIGKEHLPVKLDDSEPIGGIKSLRTRIREAEANSRMEAQRLIEQEEKTNAQK